MTQSSALHADLLRVAWSKTLEDFLLATSRNLCDTFNKLSNERASAVALAALAATASFAQSSVTISGTFDPSFASQKSTYGNGAEVTQQLIRNNSQGTSQITFKGVEDLGGGLKASFLLENDFDAGKDATAAIGSLGGEQYLALEGGFGKIAAGAPNTPSLTAQSAANPFGTKIGSGFGLMNTSHVRNNNTLVYSTPVFNGFSAAIAYGNQTKAVNSTATASTSTIGAVTTGANTDIGLNYANGPLTAGVSYWTTAATPGLPAAVAATAGAASKNEETNAYVTYDFGVAKLGAGYYTEKQASTGAALGVSGVIAATGVMSVQSLDSKAWNVSANVPLGNGLSLFANYGRKDDKTSLNLDAKIYAVGLKKELSKNTSLYARYVDQTVDNVATTALAQVKKQTTTLVGLQTNF